MDTSHLSMHSKDLTPQPMAVKFSVGRFWTKSLQHHVSDANMDPDKIINTLMELVAPTLERRMIHRNLLAGLQQKPEINQREAGS